MTNDERNQKLAELSLAIVGLEARKAELGAKFSQCLTAENKIIATMAEMLGIQFTELERTTVSDSLQSLIGSIEKTSESAKSLAKSAAELNKQMEAEGNESNQ